MVVIYTLAEGEERFCVKCGSVINDAEEEPSENLCIGCHFEEPEYLLDGGR